MALERADHGLALVDLKRTACDVWQLECQAGNVTAIVQSDHLLHGYTPPVFFAIDQLHRCSAFVASAKVRFINALNNNNNNRPPCSAEIQPMLQ